MLGLIGAGVGLAGGIFGGIKAARERRRQEKLINQQRYKNDLQFREDYYQDYMNRSDVRNAMKRVTDTMKRRNRAIDSAAAVTGATPEAVAAQKEANNQAITDTASAIQANADNYKQGVKDRYTAQDNALTGAQIGQSQQTEQGMSNLMGTSLNGMANSLANSKKVGELLDKRGGK